MRILKIMLIILALCSISVLSLSCASESDMATSEHQTATVQQGDLRIDITAVGNLALSLTDNPAFEISGTVEEILVEEGEAVEEGQVLAKLDTSEWEEQAAVLSDNLLQAEINLKNAKLALEKAQEPYSEEDIRSAEAAVDSAKYSLEYAEWQYYNAYYLGKETQMWTATAAVDKAKDSLLSAEANLEAMLDAPDPEEIHVKELQVRLAERRLDDAWEALDEALDTSPEITAPFDGFITKVNVEGGDEVLKGTVAVQLADPAKFEAELLVSEMDIFQVKLGGEASVQVDAMPMIVLPAKVTYISPTATIQAGVVNYKVKVEIQSLKAVMPERQEARQEAMPEIPPEELPERIRQAIEESRITQEQAEEMMKQRQQGQGGRQGEMPTMIPEDFQLREGLTVTVSILVDERNNVLLVPNQVITTEEGKTLVQVLKDGVIEPRSITTGISNWQYTEVIDGLSEGEQVVIPQTTTTPTTPQQGGMRIPGIGR